MAMKLDETLPGDFPLTKRFVNGHLYNCLVRNPHLGQRPKGLVIWGIGKMVS